MSQNKGTIILELHMLCGEFCTRRNTPGIDAVKIQAQKTIDTNTELTIDHSKVKQLGASFFDEIFSPLVIEYGKDRVFSSIKFQPPLDPFYDSVLESGLRRWKKN